jgi:hypothetical protein
MTSTTTLPNVGAKGVNPLKALLEFGQSPWMDYIRRDLLTSGGLKKMIQEDGLMGMTPRFLRKPLPAARITRTSWNPRKPKSWMPRAFTRRSPSAMYKTPRTSSSPSTSRPSAATVTSAWKCRRCLPTIRKAPSRKHGGSGKALGVKT